MSILIFTNTDFNVSRQIIRRKFKRAACISSLAVCLVLTACSASTDISEHETSTEESFSQILTFNDYGWETPYDEIKLSEVIGDIKELNDYGEYEEENNMNTLLIQKQNVAGYKASIYYIFSDGKLVAGRYDIGLIKEEGYNDLSEKLVKKYGVPYTTKESTGWGRLSIWVDDSNNVICLSELLDLLYMKNESPYLDLINEKFIEYHRTNLKAEIVKAWNLDGL